MFASSAILVALAGAASAGSILWDGRANAYESSAFLNDWSFSNEVGPYQYYIHGPGATKEYVNLGTAYKNPADSSSKEGIQITIDNSSIWNNDGMLRTELIPQTAAAINTGKRYYHFSMQHTATNPPSAYEEHQVCFFESHFTEMKYGLISGEQGTSDTALRWEVNSVSQWNVTFAPNVWHNIAYEIDFDAGSVGFYHSTGADDLKLTISPVSVSASSNGADWHLGVLRLPSTTGRSDTAAEDWHFSGVYIESGDLTTSVSGPGSGSGSSSSAVSTAASSTAGPSTSSKVAATLSTKPSSIAAPSSSTKRSSTVKVLSTPSIPTSSSSAVPATSSAKPTSSPKPATSSTVALTTLTTHVKSSSSAEVAPVSASSNVGTSTVVSMVQPPSMSIAAPTSVTSTSSSSAIASFAQSSTATSGPPPHRPHRHHHITPSSSNVVSPVSTSNADPECVVNYVYV